MKRCLKWLLLLDLLWWSSTELSFPLRARPPPVVHVLHASRITALTAPANSLLADEMKFSSLESHMRMPTVNQYMLATVRVQIGVPPQEFNVVVDTGSSALVVPSSRCISPCVATRRFDIYLSRTMHPAGCEACECEQCSETCAVQCQFQVTYTDGSGASGGLLMDIVTFGGNISSNMTFLAFDSEIAFRNGHLTDDYIQGILGLGPARDYCPKGGSQCQPMNSLAALASQNNVPQMFTVRFGNGLDEDGVLVIGGNGSTNNPSLTSGTLQWAQLQGGSNYQVFLHGLRIQDSTVIDQGAHLFGRTLIDSGTNVIILADAAYDLLQMNYQRLYSELPAVATYKSFWNKTTCRSSSSWTVHPNDDCKYCMFASKVDITQYPDLVFIMDDDVQLVLPATRYFYMTVSSSTNDLLYCLGISSASSAGLSNKHTSILGQVFLQGFATVFDVDNGRVGFVAAPKQTATTESFNTILTAVSITCLVILAVILLRQYRNHQRQLKQRFELGLPSGRQM